MIKDFQHSILNLLFNILVDLLIKVAEAVEKRGSRYGNEGHD
jgi:hypothetical protein